MRGSELTPVTPFLGFYEPFCSLSHLVGAAAFLVLGVFLVRRTPGAGARVAVGVFVFTSVSLLSLSGVYHLLPEGPANEVLVRLDHAAIYGLIAGSFTPVLWFYFHGAWRWVPMALVWLAAATSITFKTIYFDDVPDAVGTASYLVFGWAGAILGVVMWRRRGFRVIALLLASGVTYSLGAILLGVDDRTLVPGLINLHEVWHLAVLAGLALHWAFVLRAVRESAAASAGADPEPGCEAGASA